MIKILKAFSVIVFLLGSLAITLTVLWAWLNVVVMTAQQFSVAAASLEIASTFMAVYAWPAVVRSPWDFWFSLWKHVDAELMRRLS